MSIFICEVLFCTVHVYVRHIWSSSILYRVLDIFKIKLRKHTKFLSICVSFVSLASFRIPRRKSGIRGNQSTAIVPILRRPPEQFAVSQYIGRERSRVCLPARPGMQAESADWLITPLRTLSTPHANLAEYRCVF